LLQLHLPVHLLDAHARHEQQFPAALLRLGSGWARVVSVDRLLVQAADGDLGFILGIGLVLAYFGSLDYAPVFAKAPSLASTTINLWGSAEWSLMTVA